MAKIIRVVRENLPPVRFIGKKYKEFGHWDEWFAPVSYTHLAAAVEAGYGIELDVHLTRDDVLVVFHDDTLSRMCGISKREMCIRDSKSPSLLMVCSFSALVRGSIKSVFL